MRKLFIAMILAAGFIIAGTTGAVASHLITSQQIKDHTIRPVDLNERANTRSEVRDVELGVERLQGQVSTLHDIVCHNLQRPNVTVGKGKRAVVIDLFTVPANYSPTQHRAVLAECAERNQ